MFQMEKSSKAGDTSLAGVVSQAQKLKNLYSF